MSSLSSWGLRRLVLVLGDLGCLVVAIPIMLAIRTGRLPTEEGLSLHFIPFVVVAAVSLVVFFSAGLYDRATALVSRELPSIILGAEIVNVGIAALIFFFLPFGIAPKTNLVIYLIVSVLLVSLWRVAVPRLAAARRTPRTAVVIGAGPEVTEMVTAGPLCPLTIMAVVPPGDEAALATALARTPDFVVVDLDDPHIFGMLPAIFAYATPRGAFLDFVDLYERIFRKVPLSELEFHQFLTPGPERILYRVVKRIFDLVLTIPLSLVLIVLTPLVALAMRLESPGPIFIRQGRMGQDGAPMTVLKFRTMQRHEEGVWVGETENRVTRLGAFLRQTSIDELPQILAIIVGKLSFVGPRSDIVALGERLAEAIPSYLLRYTVTPGISGWAQVNQKYAPGKISPQSIEESRVRLAYDLYYVKHGSPFLDISIALRTVKTLIMRIIPHG